MAWLIPFLISICCLLLIRRSSALDSEKCVETFLDDKGGLDQQRFQGYWYAKYSYWPGYRAMDAQSIYLYIPGDRVGEWYIAVGLSFFDGLCFRRSIKVTETTPGARMIKEFTYFHHIIDTDYDNYAVILVCLGMSSSGRCEYPDVQTIVLSRTRGNLQQSNVWSNITAAVNDCVDLSQLLEVQQENICVCPDSKDFTTGLGKVCPKNRKKSL